MQFASGKPVMLGILIWVNEGANIGRVSLVLEHEAQWKEWGLEESGIFVCLDLSARTLTQDLFASQDEFVREGIEPLAESEIVELHRIYAYLCEVRPEVKNRPFGVLRHKRSQGIPWIFDVGGRNDEQQVFFGVRGEDVFALSRKEIF